MAKQLLIQAQPIAELPLKQWASLHEAYAQLKARLTSRDLALRDLLRALREGRLQAAVRVVRRDGTETVGLLPADFWCDVELVEWTDGNGEERVSVRLPRGQVFASGTTWHFFVRRGQLAQLIGTADADEETRQQAAIRQVAAELWPNGYEHVSTKTLVSETQKELRKKGLHVSSDITIRRTLGRKKTKSRVTH